MSDLDVYDDWVERLDAPTRQHVERMNGRISDLTMALSAERARTETYKQQAVVNGQRRDMEREMREMRETAEQQLATERARAEAAEGREARLREAGEILLNRARHRGCCASTRAGMACDCGLSEARAALAGTPEGEQ